MRAKIQSRSKVRLNMEVCWYINNNLKLKDRQLQCFKILPTHQPTHLTQFAQTLWDCIVSSFRAEQNKKFLISCFWMFLLPSWLAKYKLEISCFFPFFKIFFCKISNLSCFQAVHLKISAGCRIIDNVLFGQLTVRTAF